MTHLRIEQNGITEEVSSLVIDKLYNIVHNNTLDNTSNLLGRLHTALTYRNYITYLNTEYPELHISTDAYAIPFEDPNMITYLNSIGVGSNGYVTEALAAATTIVANSVNTTVTKFNELKYFTNITSSKGGISGGSGYARFSEWTALEEVDISNFTSIGHNHGYGWEDTFNGCSALKTVTASDKLVYIGHRAFYHCSNLEDVTGLPSNITVYNSAFSYCSKLKNSNFQNVTVNAVGTECFRNCVLLESMQLDSNMTIIPSSVFRGCTSLLNVTGLSNIVLINEYAFQGCTSLSTLSDLSAIVKLGSTGIFSECSSLIGNVFPNTQFNITGGNYLFAGCNLLTLITLSSQHTSLHLGSGAFHSCTNLLTINNSSNITVVGNGAFARCTNLTSLDLSNLDLTDSTVLEAFWSSCNYNGNSNLLFSYCNNLTTIGINIFSNITRLASDVFIDCKKLTGSLSFPDLTTLSTSNYGRQFRNCELLTKLSFGHITQWGTTMSNDAARGMATGCINLKILDLGDSVETVYLCNCYKDTALEAVLINVSTPPTITGGAAQLNSASILSYLFGNLSVIVYVPDAAVNTYKAADKWSVFANNIKGLSEYNEASILGS